MTWTLVTGGARNVGAAICRCLASRGHSLVIHYKTSQEAAESLAEECRQEGLQAETIYGALDSTEETQEFLLRYLERFGETEALVNNVGNYIIAPPLATEVQDWKELFQTNVFAPVAITQALLPAIRKRKGRVINLGVAGLLRQHAETYSTAYTATKDALWRYTCSLADQLAPEKVTVNMVSPGMLACSVDCPKDPSVLPMRRCGEEKEVAELIAYLMSPAADYITGQNIEVAGGLRLR